VVESLIADYRKQLEKLLDLYLADAFPKEMLTERKTRLETTIKALEKEQAGLVAKLEAQTLTENEIRTLQEFAVKIGAGLEQADFQARCGVIEALDIQVTLTVEDEVKVAYLHCALPGQDAILVMSQHTRWSARRYGR
jgi:hypothetical protein